MPLPTSAVGAILLRRRRDLCRGTHNSRIKSKQWIEMMDWILYVIIVFFRFCCCCCRKHYTTNVAHTKSIKHIKRHQSHSAAMATTTTTTQNNIYCVRPTNFPLFFFFFFLFRFRIASTKVKNKIYIFLPKTIFRQKRVTICCRRHCRLYRCRHAQWNAAK